MTFSFSSLWLTSADQFSRDSTHRTHWKDVLASLRFFLLFWLDFFVCFYSSVCVCLFVAFVLVYFSRFSLFAFSPSVVFLPLLTTQPPESTPPTPIASFSRIEQTMANNQSIALNPEILTTKKKEQSILQIRGNENIDLQPDSIF